MVRTAFQARRDVQQEDRVERPDARLHTVLTLDSLCYWEQDEEFRFTDVVSSVAQPTGALLGKRRWELPGCRPVGATWASHRATLQAHVSFRDFEYLVRDCGQDRIISVSGEPMLVGNRFAGYRGTEVDVTERGYSARHMRETQSLLRMAMRVTRIGAWTVNLPDQTIT